jgi:hypothetical protein
MATSLKIAMAAAFALVSSATQAQAATAACDRACLKGVMTGYLAALTARDPARAPVAANVRFTEDARPARLGEGLWKTATGLGTYRQDFIDMRRGVAGAHVVVMEGAKPALVAVRLKVVDRKATEVETQVTRNAQEGHLFDLDGLKAPNPVMNRVLAGAERPGRDEIVYAAAYYPAGLKAGSFVSVDAPFTADAYRAEGGVVTAGPACTRSAACRSIKTQPIVPGRTHFQERLLAVDEELGVAWFRLSWARGEGTRLVAFEAFKVVGGKMAAVEAFLKYAPLDSGSGWD